MKVSENSKPIDHTAWSDALYAAWTSRTPIAPLTEQVPGLTIDDAYQIQQGLAAHLISDGGAVIGYKLGLTSKPMQELLGVDEPDYGPLLSPMVYDDGASIDLAAYIQPKVEAE
ncbi:MAG TPA: hypothetical protein ENH15_00100, partial [Actinobacteria bacterium]|nr:hypothetical protein [Actinomycetota bacterium]